MFPIRWEWECWLFDKMMDKWAGTYGEHGIVEQFKKSWRGDCAVNCTRVANNMHDTVPGGKPADNNGAESLNNVQKNFNSGKRFTLFNYLNPNNRKSLLALVHRQSCQDLEFGDRLNVATNNRKFYAYVVNSSREEVSPITVSVNFGEVSVEVPLSSQWRLVASHQTLEYLANCDPPITTLKKCICGVDFEGNDAGSWCLTWLGMWNGDMEPYEGFEFDDAIKWGKAFYLMKPILDGVYLNGLYNRMNNSGLTLITLDALIALEGMGLMSCSCGMFLHYTMCVHVMEDALRKKIVKRIPDTMELRPIVPGAGAGPGAKKKARKGGAYDWN